MNKPKKEGNRHGEGRVLGKFPKRHNLGVILDFSPLVIPDFRKHTRYGRQFTDNNHTVHVKGLFPCSQKFKM